MQGQDPYLELLLHLSHLVDDIQRADACTGAFAFSIKTGPLQGIPCVLFTPYSVCMLPMLGILWCHIKVCERHALCIKD